MSFWSPSLEILNPNEATRKMIDEEKRNATISRNELFNNIQKCRGDIAIMSGKGYRTDLETIGAARALVRELSFLKIK